MNTTDTDAPGARPIRVGLMVPANNTTMEVELLGWLPPGSTCTTLPIPRGPGLLTEDTIPAYRDAAVELSRQFARDDIDVVVYGCTAAGFILGPPGDAAIARDLAAATGKPVVTTAHSMMLALEDIGALRIAVLTPYDDHVNERLRAFLGSGDLDVVRLDSFHAQDTAALGRITAEQVLERAWPLCTDDVDAVFIACSQLPTFDAVGQLNRESGKRVLSSIQVTAQQALRAA